jgi:hypothetical protein
MRPANRPRWLIAAFGLAMGLFMAFSLHALWVVTHLSKTHGPVEGWMTPGYVQRSYDVAPEALADALGVDPGTARGQTLNELAKARGLPGDVLLAAVQAVVPQ